MTPSGWSELPSDVFLLITPHLDTLHLIRCSAVCTTWNHHLRTNPRHRLPLPWLMLSSFNFYSLNDRKTFRIAGPTDHPIVGTSSSGFLLSHLHATNPLTGSHLHFPPLLPSSSPHLVVLSPTNTAAAFHSHRTPPSFARAGDDTWTALSSPPVLCFTNAVFHKGLLHAISLQGRSAAYDLDRPSDW